MNTNQYIDDSKLPALNRLFIRSLLALGRTGEDECGLACQLAAAGWSELRQTQPREAERLNGVLHALAQFTHLNPATEETIHVEGA
jgi:hypothetical protein